MEAFQKVVDLNPSAAEARLFLGQAWMSQYVPGAETAWNVDFFRHAQDEFMRVLQSDANNLMALNSLASLHVHTPREPGPPREAAKTG